MTGAVLPEPAAIRPVAVAPVDRVSRASPLEACPRPGGESLLTGDPFTAALAALATGAILGLLGALYREHREPFLFWAVVGWAASLLHFIAELPIALASVRSSCLPTRPSWIGWTPGFSQRGDSSRSRARNSQKRLALHLVGAPELRREEADVEAKEAVRALLDRLSDDCTVDDILYHLYVLQAVERGQRDVAAGRTIPHEEIDSALRRKWLRAGEG